MGGRIYLILFGILFRLAHRFLFPVPHGLCPDILHERDAADDNADRRLEIAGR